MTAEIMLITGASSGIGLEIAKIHAQEGGDLVLIARREELLKRHKSDLERSCKVRVHVLPMDITAPNAVEKIFSFLEKQEFEIDYFINNAGFGGTGKFFERDFENDQDMIQLNIVAATNLLRAFGEKMAKRKKGRILNVGSTAGYLPGGPNQAVYCATKAYVNSLSKAVATELRQSGVSVTLLSPGATETEFAKVANAQSLRIFKNAASARQVALDAYKGMLAGKTEVISGLAPPLALLLKILPLLPQNLALRIIEKEQNPLH